MVRKFFSIRVGVAHRDVRLIERLARDLIAGFLDSVCVDAVMLKEMRADFSERLFELVVPSDFAHPFAIQLSAESCARSLFRDATKRRTRRH